MLPVGFLEPGDWSRRRTWLRNLAAQSASALRAHCRLDLQEVRHAHHGTAVSPFVDQGIGITGPCQFECLAAGELVCDRPRSRRRGLRPSANPSRCRPRKDQLASGQAGSRG